MSVYDGLELSEQCQRVGNAGMQNPNLRQRRQQYRLLLMAKLSVRAHTCFVLWTDGLATWRAVYIVVAIGVKTFVLPMSFGVWCLTFEDPYPISMLAFPRARFCMHEH